MYRHNIYTHVDHSLPHYSRCITRGNVLPISGLSSSSSSWISREDSRDLKHVQTTAVRASPENRTSPDVSHRSPDESSPSDYKIAMLVPTIINFTALAHWPYLTLHWLHQAPSSSIYARRAKWLLASMCIPPPIQTCRQLARLR